MARPAQYYVATGKTLILELVTNELAVTRPELEAKLAHRVHPHHLTTALLELQSELRIAVTTETYGGFSIAVIHPYDLSRRETAHRHAAQRKRRLTARYLRWATSTTEFVGGVLGQGAEAVFHASLLEAASSGYLPARLDGGDVSTLLGAPVEGGPLDSPAFLQTLGASGLPNPPVLIAPFGNFCDIRDTRSLWRGRPSTTSLLARP
jgi:hypothetical protein